MSQEETAFEVIAILQLISALVHAAACAALVYYTIDGKLALANAIACVERDKMEWIEGFSGPGFNTFEREV